MGHPRPVNFKGIPASFMLFTALMVMNNSGSAQPAPTQRQRAVCSLNFHGRSNPETPESMVAFAELHCNSTSPVSIGVNSTYLGKHVPHFTGVQVVSGLPCQQQGQGRWKTSGGTRMSLLAVLYFCGDYDITLLQPRVLNMIFKQSSSDWSSAVLAFGGSTVATIRQGSFVGNSADSTIVAFQTASLRVEDHTVFNHSNGFFGAGIGTIDEADLAVRDVTFSYNTAILGGALGCSQNASVSIDSCLFHNNRASNTGGAVEVLCLSGQQATVSNTTFHANSADAGGAVYVDVNTNTSIENSSFTANHASTSGGGMYLGTSSAVTATGCTFDMNNASYGGGLFCDGCSVQADRLSITHNNAVNVGGGLSANNHAQINVTRSTWHGNTADEGAGVAFGVDNAESLSSLAAPTLNVSESSFNNNTATTGGACNLGGSVEAIVSSTTFQGNRADFGGAAYLGVNTSISIENGNFTASHASNSGGGMYLDTSSTVTAAGCTFEMNNATSGGGLYCDGCSLQADRLSFTHNNAINDGGGLSADNNAQINVTSSTWHGNAAAKGAGIALAVDNAGSLSSLAAPTLNVSESTFSNNTATTTGGACNLGGSVEAIVSSTTFQGNRADFGGAAYLGVNTSISIENGNFTASHASNSGGGIFMDTSSAVTAAGCTFEMNNATSGGGLYCDGCSLQADRLSFTHNNAINDGGGLSADNNAQINVTSSTWHGNAAAKGAGIALAVDNAGSLSSLAAPTLNVSESTFSNNTATTIGGACNLGGSVEATVSNTTFQGNTADFGGAAYLDVNTNISIENSSCTANHASTSGGGMYLDTSSAVTATGCTFDMNNATSGGGLYCDGCLLQADRLSFTHNNAVNDGGGLSANNQLKINVTSSTWHGNTAAQGAGIAFSVTGAESPTSPAAATLIVSASTFNNNNATAGGGACDLRGSVEMLVTQNCSFSNNSALFGGAISVDTSANLTLSNSSLLHNSAGNWGGALYLSDKSVALVTAGSIISGNAATTHNGGGGGICASDNSSITINGHSKVQGNTADSGGGVWAFDSAQVILKGTSVSGNQAMTTGGGLYFDDNARGNLTGCEVTLNEAGQNGGGLVSGGQTVLALRDCLVANNSAGGSGGGIMIGDAAHLVLLGDSSVTSNHADFGWGGGVSLYSASFDLDQVRHAVQNNSGQYDVDVESTVTHLTIVGNTSIYKFANRIGKGDGLLPVTLNVSGYYGLPCQNVQVQAVLQGTFLGLNSSDEHGLVHLGLRMIRPPGTYGITLTSLRAPGLPAANLTLHIRSCIRGEVTPSADACQPCQQGFFSFDASQKVCSACPGNANCSGGDVITPLPGYWRSSADSVQIHRCPNPTACNPTGNSAPACAADRACGTTMTYKDLQCASGHCGNLCGVCLPGTGATRLFVCRQCMRSGAIIALYVAAAVVLLCLVKLMCHLNSNQDQAANHADDLESKVPAAQLLRPLLLYSQYMLIVSSMPVEWPASIGYPLKVLAWVWSSTSPETLSIDCLLPRGTHLPISIQKVLFYVCTPLVILGLLLLVDMSHVQYLRVQQKHVAMRVKDLLHSTALVAVFFFYPSILRNLFSMFACIAIDQPAAHPQSPAAIGSYWVMDMNQQCFTGYHRAWSLGFGLPCVLVVCLGLPLGVLVLMLKKRAHLAEPTTRQLYGFLYMSYRQPMLCWECVVMTQTMVLVAISVFGVNLGLFYQVIVMNAALTLMEILLLIFKPYAYHQAGTVMLQAVFCLLLTSYTALTFLRSGDVQPSPEYGIIMGCVLLLVNLVYVVSVVWQMIRLVNWKQVWGSAKGIRAKLMSQMQPWLHQ